jgi:hypothetical protein
MSYEYDYWEYEEADCFYEDDREEEICSECNRETVGEGCEECGTPLCPFCFSSQGGFCTRHPSRNYKPDYRG